MFGRKKIFIIIIPVTFICFILLAFYFQLPNKIFSGRYKISGIDVSHYQGGIDWEDIEKQGVEFAYIKATEGSSYVDECYESNRKKAEETGIHIGFYHFFSFESPGITQAEHYIGTVGGLEGKLILYYIMQNVGMTHAQGKNDVLYVVTDRGIYVANNKNGNRWWRLPWMD